MAAELDPATALIAEQFSHACDLLRADIRTQTTAITTLNRQTADFETRIRDLTTSSTQFKFLATLATGGGLLSIVTLLKVLIAP